MYAKQFSFGITFMYLNCKTYFSFRYGTMSHKALVDAAVEHGVKTLGLTNINSTCDCWDFVGYCRHVGINPVLGAEIRNGDTLLYILIAANNAGFACINSFITEHLQAKKDFPLPESDPVFFNNPADGFVIYPLGNKDVAKLGTNERLGIRPTEVTRLYQAYKPHEAAAYVMLQPVTFLTRSFYNVHRLLRAIDKNVLLSKLPATATCSEDENFVSPTALLSAYKDYPAIVTNTYRLLESCSIEMEFYEDKNKKVFSASAEDDRILLAKLAKDGLSFRYKNSKPARERVAKELKIINDLGFNAYFLITWDLIRYAQSRGFYYVGRGSGANSIVAYCLQITDVDPIELDLYFERFLNPYRTSPPDFDMDFSWLDRDEVIDYVFKRYGKQHVALLGMYSTFQYRAVVRELGKVFGLPKEDIDNLAGGAPARDSIQALILSYGRLIVNFPNHLSIHPGGILITEKPITEYAAVFMPPKGFPTVQLDMFIAENIGLYKLDVLSQRGLGHIKEAMRLIRSNHGIDVNIHDFNKLKKDLLVSKQIETVNTIGCFYIESPAMRQLLKKLECNDYITLVAASSIIRPGVSSSGMMKAYIERYHDPANIDYIHPVMKELLQETYGVMVYQEDVIKVAHHFAGLDMGEADILRRAMSGKYRGNDEMMRIKNQFFSNCNGKGYPPEITAEIWRQIESFGGYSFSKAHSASFAVESYQSLYLKTYFPKEFMVAVINNFGGFYSRELYFLELRKTGAGIHLPCVNNSDAYTNIRGNDVYMGFIHIKSLQQ
ncbi:MAG: DNA polymerase III subunit alpha, partial [Ferruginibacter sp.]